MNEVARCTQVALALGVLQAQHPDRQLAIVNVGTSAGLGLFPTATGTPSATARRSATSTRRFRSTASCMASSDRLRRCGCGSASASASTPTRSASMTTRRGTGSRPASHPMRTPNGGWSGPSTSSAPATAGSTVVTPSRCSLRCLAAIRRGPLIAVIDAYTAVFFDDRGQRRMSEVVAECGSRRDVAWISLDPLVPLGTAAQRSVQALDVPPRLVQMNTATGACSHCCRSSPTSTAARGPPPGHRPPSGARMEWLDRRLRHEVLRRRPSSGRSSTRRTDRHPHVHPIVRTSWRTSATGIVTMSPA